MPAKFDLKQSSNGKYLFNLKAANGQVILTSGLYDTRDGALHGIESVRQSSAIEDGFERRESTSGQPYFVLKAGNDEILGRSEMYESKASVDKGIDSVRRNAPAAEVREQTV